ncbi:MAG: DUF2868 domain-containing protein, partial [bacterium]|nr:DUF2868 domain-containing protein [bacterium]
MEKTRWTLSDIIDLEYFLHSDEGKTDESDRKSLAKRDRDIYLSKIQPLEKKDKSFTPRIIIRSWLEQRRKMEGWGAEPKRRFPGEAFDAVRRLLGFVFLLLGILSGAALAFSFLTYSGAEPLNVTFYLVLFVFLQCLSLVLLMGVSLIRKMRRSSPRASVIYNLVSGLMAALVMKIKHHALKTLSGSRRDSLKATAGMIEGKRRVYGSLFYWPAFMLIQVLGVGFNLGVLCATLVKVLGSDIAFG